MKMRDKPNVRRRTMRQFKENAMHWHCERPVRHFMNHIQLNGTVLVIVTTVLVLLLLPAIVNCDNNNVLNEIDNGGEVHAKNTLTELTGGRVIGEKWLRQIESPYSLEMDLTVERSGKLFIEPGVTIHVAPMVGITVRGVLTALVSSMFSFLIDVILCFGKKIPLRFACFFYPWRPCDQGNHKRPFHCMAHSFEITINH